MNIKKKYLIQIYIFNLNNKKRNNNIFQKNLNYNKLFF